MGLLDIKLDHASLLERPLADGTPLGTALDALDIERPTLHVDLQDRAGEWPLGWLTVPEGGDWVTTCQRRAGELRNDCEEMIVCGIGGSALGTQAVYAALDWPVNSLLPLWVLDNVDPSHLAWLVESADFDAAALNVISKSGGTLETMSGFLYLLNLLEVHGLTREDLARRVVATTDPERGLLRDLALKRGWLTQPVPPDVGGRFSVLTPVGLFPLAFAGVDIRALLEGAREMQEQLLEMPQRENAAWQLAAISYLLHTQGGIEHTVQYIYGDPLGLLGDWFRQLWAESLAKATGLDGQPSSRCLNPLVARGATDQHSQNQLYMEGPDNKLYGFITCEEWDTDPQILLPDDEVLAPLQYINKLSFGEILSACCRGTRDALREAGRPVYEITFPRLGEGEVGAYLQLWMLATAYAGLLYNVNAFDQPGVERSKVISRGILEARED